LIEIVENEIHSYNELILSLKFILGINELTYHVQRDVSLLFQKTLINKSNGQLEFLGSWYRNDLKIQKINLLSENKESTELLDNLSISQFEKLESNNKYNILKSIIINDENEIEVSMALLDLSEHYSSLKNKDIFDLLSSLIVEYGLEIDFEKINLQQNELLNFLVHSEYHTENFEDQTFDNLISFFRLSQWSVNLKNFLNGIKNQILEIYFDFNFYNYSFKQGVALINLFNEFQIDFPEDEIVDRILDDLEFLIEENDYNQMWQIENCGINNIFQKAYFPHFYNTVKRIQIEQVRNSLSEYIFEDILQTKGINNNALLFFKENSNEYSGMYLWAKKRLSIKLLEQNEVLSYVTIKDNNVLLLERLLLNIVSKRENLKAELNIHILKYYGLDWVVNLDNEYEKLIN
jgi:hypothetical protein